MSPRAACRLETLGFSEVFDYVAGKHDWLARGLPTQGETLPPVARDVTRDDVVTCGLADRVADARARVDRSPHGFALVLSGTGVVLGRLRRSTLDAAADARAGDVMEAGPSTVRLDSDLGSLVERMQKRDLAYAIVTTPDGELAGILRRTDAEARLGQST